MKPIGKLASAGFMTVALAIVAMATILTSSTARAQGVADMKTDWREKYAYALGMQAYVFGFPYVYVPTLRWMWVTHPGPAGGMPPSAPLNHFHHVRNLTDASYRDGGSPNNDTLYSVAWLDLGKEPVILSHPDMGDRYYLMSMLSGWTDVFASPGARTTGGKAADYLIVGPGWSGNAPAGMTVLRSPTAIVWVLGRTYCAGTPDDFKATHAVMDKYALTPLKRVGQEFRTGDFRPICKT